MESLQTVNNTIQKKELSKEIFKIETKKQEFIFRHLVICFELPIARTFFELCLTCTVLNLLFHCSPKICTSIVFRDRGHCYITIPIVFPANHKQSFKYRCRSPLELSGRSAVVISVICLCMFS